MGISQTIYFWVAVVIILVLAMPLLAKGIRWYLGKVDEFVEDDPEQLSDEGRGLYRKHYVRKIDDPTGKHRNCFFFVLDLTHDPHAIPAARAYADSCRGRYPILARELESFNPSRARVVKKKMKKNYASMPTSPSVLKLPTRMAR